MGSWNEKLPSGFLTLAAAQEPQYEDREVNVIAILVDHQPTVSTRGSDYSTVLGLYDPSVVGTVSETSGVKARFFTPLVDAPKITGIGDVVLLRKIKSKTYNCSRMLLRHFETRMVVFPAMLLSESTGIMKDSELVFSQRTGVTARAPDVSEQAYARKLYQWAVSILSLPEPMTYVELTAEPTATAPAAPKFRLLSEAKEGVFQDIVGEVVKIWPGEPTALYVTDYTENKNFYSYKKDESVQSFSDGDPFGYAAGKNKVWQGPAGCMTIQLSLYHPHNSWANQNLHEKDTVFIRNVHMRVSPQTSYLEGVVHTDKKRPDEVAIRKFFDTNDRRFLDLKARQEQIMGPKSPKKRPASPVKNSRGQRKKARKKAKEKEEAQKSVLSAESAGPANSYVVCAGPDHPNTAMSYIINDRGRAYTTASGKDLTLPFINRKCKLRVRVVDYFPHDLADFASSLDNPDYNDVTKSQTSISVTPDDYTASMPANTREWSFFLLLEDAEGPPSAPGQKKHRLRVLVSQQEAQYLLKLDACDLRKDPMMMAELKEKLFVLWGNLEETKSLKEQMGEMKVSSNPFDCWVVEYGVATGDGGWERMFKMEQTTIR